MSDRNSLASLLDQLTRWAEKRLSGSSFLDFKVLKHILNSESSLL